jgi:hypothetical protein
MASPLPAKKRQRTNAASEELRSSGYHRLFERLECCSVVTAPGGDGGGGAGLRASKDIAAGEVVFETPRALVCTIEDVRVDESCIAILRHSALRS